MKKLFILSIIFCLLTWCSNNTTNNKNKSENKGEKEFILHFEELTGSRESLDEMDNEIENLHNYTDSFSKDYRNNKSLTFNFISAQLEDTPYHIEYKSWQWNSELLNNNPILSKPRTLYKWKKVIWTWNGILSFQKELNQFILCYTDDWIRCIINWKTEKIWNSLDQNAALPKLYKWDYYKVQYLWEWKSWTKYWVFKNDKLLYEFEAEFPVDTEIQSFIVDDKWWRLFYRTIDYWTEKALFNLIHNWQNLSEINWFDEIIWLYQFENSAFYFYKKSWLVYYNINWFENNTQYEDIIHDMCCFAWTYNIGFRDSFISFYGKKNWKYSLIKWTFIEK